MTTQRSARPCGSGIARRGFLRGMGSACALPFLSACGGGFTGFGGPSTGAGRAAFLVPLSGDAAGVGQIMRDAASLGGTGVGPSAEIEILDSGSTPDSAVKAALAAREAGAKMIVGPLFAPQAEAVGRALPAGTPVVTLSNDTSLAGSGVFVFGVTPLQSARAVLAQAARAGKRRIAVVVPPGKLGQRSDEAVRALAGPLGLDVAPLVVNADPVAAAAAVRAQGTPDAVYLPVGGGGLSAYAQALSGLGAQLLGSTQWSAQAVEAEPALRGAWFAAPDPLRFESFARALEDRSGQRGGIIAGLAFDGVETARLLGRAGEQSRKGLLRKKGFDGVLGPFRFTADGQCERGLAVLEVGSGETSLVSATTI